MLVHFALSDQSGRSAAVEYINDEMVVTETPIVTNYYQSPSEKYEIGTEESCIRYEILDERMKKSNNSCLQGITGIYKEN